MEKILLSNNKALDLDSWYGQIEYIEHALQGRSSNVLSVWEKLKSNLASKKDTKIIINHALSMGNDTNKELQQKITTLENKLKIAEEKISTLLQFCEGVYNSYECILTYVDDCDGTKQELRQMDARHWAEDTLAKIREENKQ